jgi:hypothetical protein
MDKVIANSVRVVRFLSRCVLVVGLAAAGAFAQITGDLQINVSDASNAVIPGANISVKSVETGAERTAATDSGGGVRVSQLAVGLYEVTASHQGFAAQMVQVSVVSGTSVTVPITLSVASTAQQVEVSAALAAVNTVNGQLQTTVDPQTIIDLPVVNNGVLQFAVTAPGVTPVTPNNPFLGLGSYNSNGGRGRGNNITLDNATVTDVSVTGAGGTGLGTLPLDAIQQVNLITTQFNAEFGRNANSQFQILSKSGTNQWHGELFEFAANSFFNARDYFDRTGAQVPNINNDWGGFSGGHILKNKIFYFGSYEQTSIRGLGGTRIATVPTPAQVAAATPFAQQIITADKVPTSPTGTVTQSAPNKSDTRAFSGRLDFNLSSRDILYARFGENSSAANSTGNTFIDSNLATNGASSVNRPWTGTLTETHSFGPSTVNTLLISFQRSSPIFTPLLNATTQAPEILFNDGTSNFGTWNGLPQGRVQNTFHYTDSVAHTMGKHTLKVGVDIERIRANSFFDAFVHGAFTFLTLNDFLNANAFQYQQRFGNSVRGNRVWNEYFYAQDDWRVSRTLTLNIGFREEIAGGTTEINNIISNIDRTLVNQPLGGAGAGPLGSFYTGGSYFHTNYNPGPRFGFAWNPKADGKTVIRGGYGISYDFIFLNPITNGRFLPPYMYLFTLPQTQISGANSVASLLAANSAFQQQSQGIVGTFGSTIQNFGNVTYINPNLKNPQYQQYSLTIQRQLFTNWIVQATYAGSKGTYLQRTQPLNFLPPGAYQVPTTLAQQTAELNAGVFRNVNAGLFATATTQSNRIDPRFNATSVVQSTANSIYNSLQLSAQRRFASWYGLNVAFTWSKSMDDVSDSLGVLANDSAAQQNPFDNRNNRAVSQFDVPKRLVFSHDFISNAKSVQSGVLRNLLDGWAFSGIFQAQSGLPVNLFAGTVAGLADGTLFGGYGGSGSWVQRADLVGPVNIHFDANPGSGANNPNKIPNSGFAQPLVGHIGTLGRNVFRLNPLIQSDMSLGRIFTIKERVKLQFQAQIYNIFNNTTLSNGSTLWQLSSPSTFGYYSGTDTNSRRMTMTGRLIW